LKSSFGSTIGGVVITVTDWITALSSIMVSIATIAYVIVTKLTLNKISSQVEINRLQVEESRRFSALLVQPFFSIPGFLIKITPPSNPDNIEDWTEYMGNFIVNFHIKNTGLGPAHNIYVFSFLLGTTILNNNQEDLIDKRTNTLGLFSNLITSASVDSKYNVSCQNDLSHTFISLLTNKDKKLISLDLFVCIVFQDITSQRHLQYFDIPIYHLIDWGLIFETRHKEANEVLQFICEEAKKLRQTSYENSDILGIPLEDIKNITKKEHSIIRNFPAFKPEIVSIPVDDADCRIISLGLPSPTDNEKNFAALKSKLQMASSQDKKSAKDNILEMIMFSLETKS